MEDLMKHRDFYPDIQFKKSSTFQYFYVCLGVSFQDRFIEQFHMYELEVLFSKDVFY